MAEWEYRSMNYYTRHRWRWVVYFTRRYPFNRRPSGSQSRSGRSGEEKKSLALSEIEPQSFSPQP